jgi:hypothetical protein
VTIEQKLTKTKFDVENVKAGVVVVVLSPRGAPGVKQNRTQINIKIKFKL